MLLGIQPLLTQQNWACSAAGLSATLQELTTATTTAAANLASTLSTTSVNSEETSYPESMGTTVQSLMAPSDNSSVSRATLGAKLNAYQEQCNPIADTRSVGSQKASYLASITASVQSLVRTTVQQLRLGWEPR